MIFDVLRRENIYLWYYFQLQLSQIFRYWVPGIFIASALGIASPLCMYGTIPLAASFSESGMEDDWLAAFMMSSILLNPQFILWEPLSCPRRNACCAQRSIYLRPL